MKIVEVILDEAKKALKKNEIPVGCAIILNNKIISKSHNTRQKKHNCLCHAEINAIIKAEKRIKDWRLENCELYVTLKPCNMCMEVIKQSRIKKVYYILDSNFNNKQNDNIQLDEIQNISREIINKYKNQLQEFFVSKR